MRKQVFSRFRLPRQLGAFLALAGMLQFAGDAKADATVIDSSRGTLGVYNIAFQRISSANLPGAGDINPQSELTIAVGNEPVLLLRELTSFEPGCGAVPAISAVGKTYLVLCGHLGGRHYTYRVLRVGGGGVESATLDAFDRAAPLTTDTQGSIATLVLRRDEFPGSLTGPVYFPFVYALRSDRSRFGFEPVFGDPFKAQYLAFYTQTLAAGNRSEALPALLSALLATRDAEVICREVKKLVASAQYGSVGLNRPAATLRLWSERLTAVGYPSFDLSGCLHGGDTPTQG